MITRRRSSRRPALLALAVLTTLATVALTSCGSDDKGNGGTDPTTTSASGRYDFSTKPSAEWGDLADCQIGPQTPEPGGESSGNDVDGEIDGVLDFGKQAQEHVEGCVDYPVRPAVGGPHHMPWGNCGFYSAPVPDEIAVHILEHGGVAIAFDPELPHDQIDTIRSVVAKGTHVLANPYPGLISPVVLSAWSKQLSLDSVDDPRFQQFIDFYVQGPQTPEPGRPVRRRHRHTRRPEPASTRPAVSAIQHDSNESDASRSSSNDTSSASIASPLPSLSARA